MTFSSLFILRPVMTLLMAVMVAVFGVFAYFQLPVSALPDVEYPVIQVNAAYPGANPKVMAQNVASPLEKQFLKIRGIQSVTSTNRQGNSVITLEFALDRDVDLVAPDVQAAINAAQGALPSDMPAPPTYTKTNPNEQPILYIGLVSYSMTEGQLYDYAFKQVSQRLTTVDGVSGVDLYGSPRAIRIRVNPEKLYLKGITLSDISQAVERGSNLISAGELKEGSSLTLTLVPDLQLEAAEAYERLIVAWKNGVPVYLRDIADVVESVDNEDRRLNYFAKEVPPGGVALVMAVNKAIGANSVSVAQAIDELLPQLSDILPPSIKMKVIYSRAKSIIESIEDVKSNLITAFGLVVVIIFLFLGRVRETLVPIIVIPLSLAMTFMAMKALGYTIDNLSLMALTLAIGSLVDDAIVFLENTVRRMEDLHESPFEAAMNGAKEITFTIIATSVITISLFIPVLFMPGLMGRIFAEFAGTSIIVIVMSTLLALTLTPMMCGRMLAPHNPGDRSWIEKSAHSIEHLLLAVYSPVLKVWLRNGWMSLVVWVLCIAGVVWFGSKLPVTFLPPGDSSFISGIFLTKTGNASENVQKLQSQIDSAIQSNPYVEQFVTVSGIGDFLQNNFLIAFVSIKGPQDRVPFMPIDAINYQLLGATASIPGVLPALRPQPTLEISTGDASNQQGEYAFSLYGINQEEVYAAAQQLMGALFGKMQQGQLFANVQSDLFLDNPELAIDLDRDMASRYGIDAGNVGRLLSDAYSLNYAYLIKANNLQYQVIVEADPLWRSEAEDLSGLWLRPDGVSAPTGSSELAPLIDSPLVPFDTIARARTTLGPIAVNHIDNFSSVTIFFDLLPGVPVSEAIGFVQGLADQVVPQGVNREFRGQAQVFEETINGSLMLFVVALFIMFICLGVLYESYVHPITVMAALPIALVGALITLYVFNQELSLYAGIGLFMLLGIVQKNGIILIDFALMRRDEGMGRIEAAYEASVARFRPILMTSVSTLIGTVPLAIGMGADGAARMPLGLSIVGGLMFSQLITLFLTPAFFVMGDWVQENILDRIPVFIRGKRMG